MHSSAEIAFALSDDARPPFVLSDSRPPFAPLAPRGFGSFGEPSYCRRREVAQADANQIECIECSRFDLETCQRGASAFRCPCRGKAQVCLGEPCGQKHSKLRKSFAPLFVAIYRFKDGQHEGRLCADLHLLKICFGKQRPSQCRVLDV